ncbi:MAG: hypothetical protein KDB22_15605 [Planctomycetales bacterium]|nr:hypothetical protein [Planctomycetales bacterium]
MARTSKSPSRKVPTSTNKGKKSGEELLDSASNSITTSNSITAGEIRVLKIFRQYLMTPGRMLCLSNVGIDSMQAVLRKMIEAGLIVPDDFKGAYSLTRSGYEAMNRIG